VLSIARGLVWNRYGNTSAAQQPVDQDFVAAMVKGASGNHYAVKIGDPQKPHSLQTAYDGTRPTYGPNHTHACECSYPTNPLVWHCSSSAWCLAVALLFA
jgi:hypothetical protein